MTQAHGEWSHDSMLTSGVNHRFVTDIATLKQAA